MNDDENDAIEVDENDKVTIEEDALAFAGKSGARRHERKQNSFITAHQRYIVEQQAKHVEIQATADTILEHGKEWAPYPNSRGGYLNSTPVPPKGQLNLCIPR